MTASAGPALKRLHAEFGGSVQFVTLYVREAHPGERYPQPETFERKLQQARAYQARDQIPWPITVDSIEGDLHRALGANPNAVYIMEAQGNVAFRALWSNDERVLRGGLEAITSQHPLPIGEHQPRVVPMIKGVGVMYRVLGSAGCRAQQDVLREAPPMYGMARLTDLFGPLPPLGRGIVATAVSAVGFAVALRALRWLISR